MPIEQQVISLDLAKELAEVMKDKGITPPANLFFWSRKNYDPSLWEVEFKGFTSEVGGEEVPHYLAYTVAEMGEMLLKQGIGFGIWKKGSGGLRLTPNISLWESLCPDLTTGHCDSDTQADCLAKLLIYLLKNNLITL